MAAARLLWSVAFIVHQQQIAINAERIAENANTLFDRIRLVAEPVGKMGKSLDTAVRDYNAMLSPSRADYSDREEHAHLRWRPSREGPARTRVGRMADEPAQRDKWEIDDENALPEGASEILELDIFDDE